MLLNLTEEKIKELENSPYRIVDKSKGKRRTGKNLHPQLTLRIDPELVLQVKTKMEQTKKRLRDAGIQLSYLKNPNALTRYLFDEYLDGKYDFIHAYPKVMLPTDCPQVAIRYPKEKVEALKKKSGAVGHTYVSITTWLYKEWLKEE